MNSEISKFRKFLLDKCRNINTLFIERKRKINFNNMLFYLLYLSGNDCSESYATAQFKDNRILDVSRQAINKRRTLLKNNYFSYLMSEIVKYINISTHSKTNIYCVDGTKLSLSKDVEGFKFTKNKKYKKALLNTLYSINNKHPIAFDISSNYNEIDSFINVLSKHIKSNDIIVFDRGYYSINLIKCIEKLNANYVCRLKKSSLMVKYLIDGNRNNTIYNSKDHGMIRIVKYTINNIDYYIGTNLFHESIDYIKDLYWKRWSVEEFYKTLKCNLGANCIKYKNINKIQQYIHSSFIIDTISRYMEFLITKYINKKSNSNSAINHKISVKLTSYKILKNLLIKKSNKKIYNVLIVIGKSKISNAKGRSFKRARITPVSKWYYVGLSIKISNNDNG